MTIQVNSPGTSARAIDRGLSNLARGGALRGAAVAGVMWIFLAASAAVPQELPWQRHTIDNSSRGADGVRLADANGDGLLDIATAWEEGGLIRVYLNPGPSRTQNTWPAVTVGRVASPEDAVLADLDGDGAVDVVSSCEGRTRSVYVHWAPRDRSAYLEAAAWRTEPLPESQARCMWMFTLPSKGRNSPWELFCGGKGAGAAIGRFIPRAEARNLAGWQWHPLRDAGWIMTLAAADFDADGDADLFASDRKGPRRGCLWLENPGANEPDQRWPEHPIGGSQDEVMFADVIDLDGDGRQEVLAATAGSGCLLFRRAAPDTWETTRITTPERTGTGKSVRAGDIDRDGRLDLVLSCENAGGGKSGVVWLSARQSYFDGAWQRHEISGKEGTKFDLVQLVDLDADGDLDVLTCEERENLGVIWYENPASEER
jgi:hypothetical protein